MASSRDYKQRYYANLMLYSYRKICSQSIAGSKVLGMELRQLKFFLEIADSGSLNKAARRLNITQPALSRLLNSFEQEIGSALFERHPTGMTLTQKGQRLVAYAEDMLRRANRLIEHLAGDSIKITGTVCIGAAPGVGQHFFAPIAQRAQAAHSSIKIKFSEGHSYDMLAGLEKNEIDCAFMIDPDHQDDIEIIPLFSEALYLVGLQGDRALPKGPIKTTSLQHFPLVTYPKLTGPRKAIDKVIAKTHAVLDVHYETNTQATVKDFVRRRLAYALLTRSAFPNDINDFILIKITGLDLLRTLIAKRTWRQSQALSAVIDITKEEVKNVITQKHFSGCHSLMD